MNAWRIGFSLGLVVFVALPALAPFGGLFDADVWASSPGELERLFERGINTFLLTAATLALSLPSGVGLAVLLFRTSFVVRSILQAILAFALFVPLPILVSSWQALLGSDGLGWWLGTTARPWATGMGPAIWIHALGALPWVAFIVGLGLTGIEPELEAEAAQSVGAWRVLALVTLPRARASILAAGLFVVLQTAAETSVTDIMLVSTLADELRTQFATRDDALGRTLLMALPPLLVVWGSTLAAVAYLERRLPPPAPPLGEHRDLELGPVWMRYAAAVLFVAVLIVPCFSLIWRLGLSGHPRRWSGDVATRFMQSEFSVLGAELGATLLCAAITGLGVAFVALVGCWLARDRAWFRWLLFSMLTWAWVLPGPAVGIGLHDLIMRLPPGPWLEVLYYQPSPLPLMWAQGIRSLPIAVIFLWPVVRMIPPAWFEEARLGGAGPVSEFLHVVAPTVWRAIWMTGLAATALCLGEVAASGRVKTPGWQSFTDMLLDRMHYGVDNTLAALSLLMLGSLAALFIVGTVAYRLRFRVQMAPRER